MLPELSLSFPTSASSASSPVSSPFQVTNASCLTAPNTKHGIRQHHRPVILTLHQLATPAHPSPFPRTHTGIFVAKMGSVSEVTSAERPAFLLFGDQSLDCHSFLVAFFRQADQGELAKVFLRQACHALTDLVEGLPAAERSNLPVFSTLQQLNQRYHASKLKHAGLDAALLTVSQIAHYLHHAEKHNEDITSPENTFLIGLCSGLWAAAAISITPSLTGLVHIGVQVVILAFRTGSYVHEMGQRLSPAHEQSDSWTYIFAGIDHDEATKRLNAFHESNGIPPPTRAYISAVALSSVAVSGPPNTLDALVSHGVLTPKPVSIPVHGPYHASHLHSSVDVERLLGLNDPEMQDAFFKTHPRSPIMCCTTGSWFPTADSKSILEMVCRSILNQTLVFNKVLTGCVEQARQFKSKGCLIIPLGPTQNASTLQSLLRAQTDLEVELRRPAPLSMSSAMPGVGNQGSSGKPKLAIVGMAGRFPDAASHEKLWELLEKGLDVHRVVPADRFDASTHVDPRGQIQNTSHTPYGCWIENPGLFDPKFFSMSPREAKVTDPMQRMALTTAYEALEMSGFVKNRTPSTRLDRIGTFYGQTSDDWREINAAQDVDTYFITGGARDCDTAIVGGLNCMTNPDIFCGLSRGQFLSKKGPCATFDDGADGYCRGDGCATVIVKRLEDAMADHDRILAVILGTATNHSAQAISITHPHGPTQSALSTAILDEAGVDPLDVDYVEMHGTGTQAGDYTEMTSVTTVFAPADRKRSADRPLYLGTVKANVGHGEAASGITALIKVLLMLEKNCIPPHVGIKKGSVMNKRFPKDMAERNINIAFQPTPFLRKDGKPRRVFINNFSAAGGNTGLLLEDAPKLPPPKADPRSHHLVTVTARSKTSLLRNAERLVAWMAQHPDTPLSHVAYTTTARRAQFHWRINVTGADLAEVQTGITNRVKETIAPSGRTQPKVAFMFTGQGSQYAALGKELYEHHAVFRKAIDDFDLLARTQGFPSFMPLIDGSQDDLNQMSPVILQLGLACFEMALARLWMSWGVRPAVVIGHSLGEYAALDAAGVLSASDVIYLVGHRARLLLERCTQGSHSMLAVQGSLEAVVQALGTTPDKIHVACINGPRETVLAGDGGEVAIMAASLGGAGFKCTQLQVPYAFHSPQVEVILDDFETIAEGVSFNTPKMPVVSTLLGRVLEGESINATYLRRHAREPVRFFDGLVEAQQLGTVDDETAWIEIGPHPICANLVKASFGSSTVAVPTLRRREPCYKTLSTSLGTLHNAGLDINFNEFHRDFLDSVRLLDLPGYAFDEQNYWIQYTGDWCLTKNSDVAPRLAKAKPELSTTTVQKVVKKEVSGDMAVIEFESDLCQEQLRNVVSGHMVNGAPLCPSSLYGDMAMTACDYVYKLLRPQAKKIGCNVAEMRVPKPLIFKETATGHILRLTVAANAEMGHADLVFHTSEGNQRTDHAFCRVYYGNPDEWQDEFDRVTYLIKARVDGLLKAEEEGKASKIGCGLAYKLFTALVDYAPRYRGMQEVILMSDDCEATAKVRFPTTEEDGTFYMSPYHIDSACHISGFIINGTDAIDSREAPVKGSKMMAGDAYLLDGDKIIGMTGGIKFQEIPRTLLNRFLPPRGKAAVAPGPAPASAQPAPAAAAPSKASGPKKNKQPAASRGGPKTDIVSAAMSILAGEIGCNHDELADNVAFTDLGVDSLMSLTVIGMIREQLEVEIRSNAFVDYPTVSSFKRYLADVVKSLGKEAAPSPEPGASTSEEDTGDSEPGSGVTTPTAGSDAPSEAEDASEDREHGDGDSRQRRETIRGILSGELGVDVDEIVAAPSLADLGLDSLMNLNIVGKLQDAFPETAVPANLFTAHLTLKEIKRALGVKDPAPKKPVSKQPPPKQHPRIGVEKPAPPKPPRPTTVIDEYPHRTASSVLLSGTHKSPRQLFMIPDGSGSATSYTEIADVGSLWAVWGLFSPFLKTPHEFTCGVYGMARKYIEEIKRRKPHGPYNLAGWSAGGVIAYEIIYQLVMAGDVVDNFLIIDAPSPDTIEPLPEGLHAWFASIGLLGEDGGKKIPEWLLPHFAASITALGAYKPAPLPQGKSPMTLTVWCEDGVCKTPEDPRPEPYPKGHALFLLDNRSDFGPNKWDELIARDKMTFKHMPGNHFSMMHGKLVSGFGFPRGMYICCSR
ncbi:hypothetical protein VTJ83DRAFT_7193 [Remersonia thermophila]|uniref:Polyketide synthase n=1 Tax=Remersonia thermophila TaxID=72144 RepID=A0ABR4D2S7_9PEZI